MMWICFLFWKVRGLVLSRSLNVACVFQFFNVHSFVSAFTYGDLVLMSTQAGTTVAMREESTRRYDVELLD
jgi:hypothetical protein